VGVGHGDAYSHAYKIKWSGKRARNSRAPEARSQPVASRQSRGPGAFWRVSPARRMPQLPQRRPLAYAGSRVMHLEALQLRQPMPNLQRGMRHSSSAGGGKGATNSPTHTTEDQQRRQRAGADSAKAWQPEKRWWAMRETASGSSTHSRRHGRAHCPLTRPRAPLQAAHLLGLLATHCGGG
jgi:hypothetical protein